MKKIIGIGVIVVASLVFFDANTSKNTDFDLAKMIALNIANAEDHTVTIKDCDDASVWDTCSNNNNFPGCDNSLWWDTCEATASR